MSLRDTIDTVSDRIRAGIAGMAPRERVLVAITAVVVLCTLGYFVQRGMSASLEQVETNIKLTQQAQIQVDELMATYADLSGTYEKLDARLEAGRGFAPLTWIETVGNEMGIQSNIRSVSERGQEETEYYRAQNIDVVVDDLDLKQAVDLLYRFETAPQAVRVKDLRIKADRKNRSQLDIRIELSFLQPTEAS